MSSAALSRRSFAATSIVERRVYSSDRPTVMTQSRREIELIYRRHPLRAATLLARVLAEKGSLDNLTEVDLAIDRNTAITDQNNVGGVRGVIRLAGAAGVSAHSRVLDLACGLGGPARILADRYGCRVDGIDISEHRVRDARALTKLVALSNLVSVRRGDIMRVSVPAKRYDIIWGQSSWIHIGDKQSLINRWRAALKNRGCVAVQDSCLVRPSTNRREAGLISRLERDWAGTLIPAREWAGFARSAGLKVQLLAHSSLPLGTHFRRLSDAARRGSVGIPVREQRSWEAAIEAAHSGLIAYFTMIARV